MYLIKRKEHEKALSALDTGMLLRKSQLVVLEKLTFVGLSVNTKASQTAELMSWSLLQAVHACKVNPYCDTVPFSFGKMCDLLALS